jgi:hypothetical protein
MWFNPRMDTLRGWNAFLCNTVLFDDGWKSPIERSFTYRMEVFEEVRNAGKTFLHQPCKRNDGLKSGWYYSFNRNDIQLDRAGIFQQDGRQLTGMCLTDKVLFYGDFDAQGQPAEGLWLLEGKRIFIGHKNRHDVWLGTLYGLSKFTVERGTFNIDDAKPIEIVSHGDYLDPVVPDVAIEFLCDHGGDDRHLGFVCQVVEIFHNRLHGGVVLWDIDKTLGHWFGKIWCWRTHIKDFIAFLYHRYPRVTQGVLTNRKKLRLNKDLNILEQYLDPKYSWTVKRFEREVCADIAQIGRIAFWNNHHCKAVEIRVSSDFEKKFGALLVLMQSTGKDVCLIDDSMWASELQKHAPETVVYSRPWIG